MSAEQCDGPGTRLNFQVAIKGRLEALQQLLSLSVRRCKGGLDFATFARLSQKLKLAGHFVQSSFLVVNG